MLSLDQADYAVEDKACVMGLLLVTPASVVTEYAGVFRDLFAN
jgi:hypothetical protein